jgi:predicted TIM-barrel fold metal-dependent hydrolase
MAVDAAAVRPGERRAGIGLADCDVHNMLRSRQALERYLPKRWHAYHEWPGSLASHAGLLIGAQARPSVFRVDSFPSEGPPGSDLDLMREQLLDRYGITHAIVHPILDTLGFQQYGEFGAALARATNEWMVEEWLRRDDRIYGGITVPIEDGILAGREIERAAKEPRFVKVLLTALTREPLGHSKYWPIYEAAAAHGLPVVAHVGGFSGTQSGSGWGTYFSENHTNYVLGYSVQAASLVYSGLFDRFPELQFVFEEGGLAWLVPLMWRMDRAWEQMRADVPHLEEPPSALMRRHFWLTTQPLDEPEQPRYLRDLFEQLSMDDRVMFASDYPHHDFDDPRRVLPASELGSARRDRIMFANAQTLYRFSSV